MPDVRLTAYSSPARAPLRLIAQSGIVDVMPMMAEGITPARADLDQKSIRCQRQPPMAIADEPVKHSHHDDTYFISAGR